PAPCDGARKAALLAAADAFVLPSMRERSGPHGGHADRRPRAAAAGVPMVASAVGGVAEVFGHEQSALLVRAGRYPRPARRRCSALQADRALRRRLSRAARAVGPPLRLARARAALRGAARP
ncbi:MAG: glycosyltransferase, partial [Sandaracinaceae bacterium]|nr:glycosyltransferase [Sandaracinaceae bacterium]